MLIFEKPNTFNSFLNVGRIFPTGEALTGWVERFRKSKMPSREQAKTHHPKYYSPPEFPNSIAFDRQLWVLSTRLSNPPFFLPHPCKCTGCFFLFPCYNHYRTYFLLSQSQIGEPPMPESPHPFQPPAVDAGHGQPLP